MNLKLNGIILSLLALSVSFIILNGCNVDHSLSSEKYGRVYVAQARNNPVKYSIIAGYDSTQTIKYRANYGGPHKPKQDINVKFHVNSAAIDSFNTIHATSYPMLPKDSYKMINNNKAITIPAGNTSGSYLKFKIFGKNLPIDKHYLLPITAEVVSGDISINKKLQTAYFLFSTHIFIPSGLKPSGQGTKAKPYKVNGLRNLKWITNHSSSWNAIFVQTADIDASKTKKWNDGDGFNPIGNSTDKPFVGTYNGKGHTITGLYFNRPDEGFVGFLSDIGEAAVIKNLNLTEIDYIGNRDTGGLTGINYGKIVNVSVQGTITAKAQNDGGIVGSNHGIVKNSQADVTMHSNDVHIGGLAGYVAPEGKILHSHATGDVFAGGNGGGLAGDSHGTIIHCYSTGDVRAPAHSNGGLVGYMTGKNAVVKYSYSTGDVTSVNKGITGGLVGYAKQGKIIGSFSTGDAVTSGSYVGGLVGDTHGVVKNSYATGDAKTSGNYAGGLTARNYSATIKSCYTTGKATTSTSAKTSGSVAYPGGGGTTTHTYWDTQTSGLSNSDQGTGLKTSQMQGAAAKTNMKGFDFTNVWQTNPGGYPTLRKNPPPNH